MSETKRATFTTISTQKSDVKKVKERPKTIRFTLSLPESNEKSCPEYNYRDLLNSAEKKNKSKEKVESQVNGVNHADPFGDDDDADVKRIAKQFEEKYGLPPNKKRKGKKDDYADIGAGYDESDSFIDNTDAYDEMVPEDVTTVHGGFYINSGALEFKQVELSGSESSDSENSDVEKPVNRKRIIEDTDESDSEEEKEDIKIEQAEKKPKLEANGVQKPAKKKLTTDEKENIIKDNVNKDIVKKKKLDDNIQKKKPVTVKDLLREKREEFDMTPLPESPQKEMKPPGSSTINDVIESVINAGRVVNVDETSKDSSSSMDHAVPSSESESSRDGLPVSSEAQKIETELPIVKLPDNLPENITKIISDIKKAAENSEGKVKFFSGHVNNMLLSLEMHSRKLPRSDRLQIFEHLAPFVKCKKDTLMRRAKNLLLDQERSKLKDPLSRLKTYVDNAMPVVRKNYEKECQKVRDEMFLASAAANPDGDINKANKLKFPKKRFPWSEESRKIFQEIINIQKKYFTLVRTRKETFETNLETFLKASVLPIWPEGFMSISSLMKQSKLILESIEKRKPSSTIMSPISLDIYAPPAIPAASTSPMAHSPVKNMSLSPCATSSGITVIPISQSSQISPKAAASNGPKLKPNPPIKFSESNPPVKSREINPPMKFNENNSSIKSREINPPIKFGENNPPVKSREINPPIKFSETNPPVKSREINPLIKFSENNPTVKSLEINPPIKFSETNPPVKSLEINPPIKFSENNPPVKPREINPPIKFSENNPPVKSREINAPMKSHEMNAPMKSSEINAPIKFSEMNPPIKSSEMSVTVNKKVENSASVLNTSAEICAVTKETKDSSERVPSSLLIPSSKSNVTITSVDLRTNNTKKDSAKEDMSITVTEPSISTPIPPPAAPKPTNLKQRILNDLPTNKPRDEDCQIIDLTETPVVVRKPGPKSKTRFIDGTAKLKRNKEPSEVRLKTEDFSPKIPEEITGSQALNQLITGFTKYGSNSAGPSYKENTVTNEDEMEQVMKDLKELQQLQEHARKNDLERLAPSGSPVSVIAFNSNYASSRLQASDLSTKERKIPEGPGFQDIFQKHLHQDAPLKSSQSSSVYNSNVQPKNSYNSVNNFSYSSAGSISSSMNNIRYSQSSSKYTSPVNHLPTNPTGATNADDFALFQNFLYQYGLHNSSGPKQKSPP